MGNSVTGSSLETRTMDYFDRLPRSVRQALQDARFDWACLFYLTLFESRRITAKDIVKRIEGVDASKSAAERRQIWGPDYPRLKGELPAPRKQQ